MSQRLKKTILVIGDVVVLYASLWLTLLIRYQSVPDTERWSQHLGPFTIVYALWMLVFFIGGLYTITALRGGMRFISNLVKTMGVNAMIGAVFFYLTPFVGISPKTNFLINIVLATLLVILWRHLANKLMGSSAFRLNVLLIGNDEQLKELSLELDQRPQLGYAVAKTINPMSVNATNVDLARIVTDNDIRVVAAESSTLKSEKLVEQLFNIMSLKITVVDIADFMEEITGKVAIDKISQAWFLKNLDFGKRRGYDFFKRVSDILISATLLVLLSWLILLTMLLVLVTSGRPVFYTQKRTGQLGKPFNIIKFRSMIKSAEKDGAKWATKNDDRITAFGRFMRKTRIDEIPQLINVIRGEMSLVGPRPERPVFVEQLRNSIPFYNERHLMKPGLTGWAQINFKYGSSEEDAMEKLQYDLYYIKNRSFVLDTAIALKTTKTILSISGQ